jgi:hypothetical protein
VHHLVEALRRATWHAPTASRFKPRHAHPISQVKPGGAESHVTLISSHPTLLSSHLMLISSQATLIPSQATPSRVRRRTACAHPAASIWLTATSIWSTPSERASAMCSPACARWKGRGQCTREMEG